MSDVDALKKAAALAALELVTNNAVVGLGSGSTLVYFIQELGVRVRSGRLQVVGVPTSFQSHFLAKEAGIPLLDPMGVERVDITVDGADEIDPAGNLVKGGGGAHIMEKLVAAMAKQFVVVADESKPVSVLGARTAVPVEVITPALAFVMQKVREFGGQAKIRSSNGKLGPVMSDLGHPILDVKFDAITDAARLNQQLNAIPGIVGHGLFVGMADQTLVACSPLDSPKIETRHFRRIG
ncbi:MAG: ribose-5-phosphate isomerase RpiA [Deltaproteobacteria bacterium]|nr:ribose-5-phosphate isomerase RpiA [Deltaproteobacteria bacterium]